MAVTFGTPVVVNMTTTTSIVFAMSGVTSGQPICIMRYAWDTGNPSSITDTFSTGYQWGVVDSQIFSGVIVNFIIGTEGVGTSGNVTVNFTNANNGGIAVACNGASTAHLTAALDVFGHNTGTGVTSTLSLTPTVSTGGAFYCWSGNTVDPTGPTAPWVNNDITTGGTRTAGISTYESPPAGALAASWTTGGAGGTWGTVGGVVLSGAQDVTSTFEFPHRRFGPF